MVAVIERPPREQAVWPDVRNKQDALDAVSLVLQDLDRISDEQQVAANKLVDNLKKYQALLNSEQGLAVDTRKSFLKVLCALEAIKISEGIGDTYEQARLLTEHYGYALKAGVLVGNAERNGHILSLIHQYQGSDKAAIMAADAVRLTDDGGEGINNEYREHSIEYRLQLMAEKTELGTADYYLSSLEKAAEVYQEQEGVVELEHKDVPTLVIPDLHGRRDFLLKVMETSLEWPEHSGRRTTVYNLLREDLINVVCVGDVIHIEKDLAPYDEAKQKKDLLESFETMNMVIELVAEFDNFVVVRGNHDNISDPKLTKTKAGTQIFQSKIFKEQAEENFGEDFISSYTAIQAQMPLVAISGSTIISHAAPMTVLTREEINSRSEMAFYALTTTDNSKDDLKTAREQGVSDQKMVENVKRGWASYNTSEEFIRQTATNLDVEDPRWICGHRPVTSGSMYRHQYDHALIQICDSKRELTLVLSVGSHSFMAMAPGEVTSLGGNIFTMLKDADRRKNTRAVVFEPAPDEAAATDHKKATAEEAERSKIANEAQRIFGEIKDSGNKVDRLAHSYKQSLKTGAEIQPQELQESVTQIYAFESQYNQLSRKVSEEGSLVKDIPDEIKKLVFDIKTDATTGRPVKTEYSALIDALKQKVEAGKSDFFDHLQTWTTEQIRFVNQKMNQVLRNKNLELLPRAVYSETAWQQSSAALIAVANVYYRNCGSSEATRMQAVALVCYARGLDTTTHPVVGKSQYARFEKSLERRINYLDEQLYTHFREAYQKIQDYALTLSPLQAIAFLDRMSVIIENEGPEAVAGAALKQESLPAEWVEDIAAQEDDNLVGYRYRVIHGTVYNALGTQGERAMIKEISKLHVLSQMDALLKLDNALFDLDDRLTKILQITGTDNQQNTSSKERKKAFIAARAIGLISDSTSFQRREWQYDCASLLAKIISDEYEPIKLDNASLQEYKTEVDAAAEAWDTAALLEEILFDESVRAERGRDREVARKERSLQQRALNPDQAAKIKERLRAGDRVYPGAVVIKNKRIELSKKGAIKLILEKGMDLSNLTDCVSLEIAKLVDASDLVLPPRLQYLTADAVVSINLSVCPGLLSASLKNVTGSLDVSNNLALFSLSIDPSKCTEVVVADVAQKQKMVACRVPERLIRIIPEDLSAPVAIPFRPAPPKPTPSRSAPPSVQRTPEAPRRAEPAPQRAETREANTILDRINQFWD